MVFCRRKHSAFSTTIRFQGGNIMSELSARVRLRREELHLSQEELAQQLNVSGASRPHLNAP